MIMISESILSGLKQKYPFTFVDKVIRIKYQKAISTVKNITFTDVYGQCGSLKLPLFVILELMGQTSELLIRQSWMLENKTGFLAGIQDTVINSDFKVPGQLRAENNLLNHALGIYKSRSVVYFNEQLCAEGTITHIFR